MELKRYSWPTCNGLRGSASPVLTAAGFVNGRWQFSTPHRIHTPWPITKKFVVSDYVGDPYICAKFGANPSTGGFWANRWNITKFLFIYLTIFIRPPHSRQIQTDRQTDKIQLTNTTNTKLRPKAKSYKMSDNSCSSFLPLCLTR